MKESETRNIVENFVKCSIKMLEKSFIKRSCKIQIDEHSKLIIRKTREIGYIIDLEQNNLTIEIPSHKSLEEIVDIITEYVIMGRK